MTLQKVVFFNYDTLQCLFFYFSFKKSTPGWSISVLVGLLVCGFVLSFIALCYKH